MMHASEITAKLKDYLVQEVLGGQDIGLNGSTPLMEWGIIDSLTALRLIAHIQESFEVEVPADQVVLDNFKDLASLTDMIVELRANH